MEKPKKLFPNQPATASPKDAGDALYPNCAAVREAGKAPIRKGEPGYSARLDRDGDGIACE
ncbi:excalibur calcium-binding domain-containing protein [Cohnella hongkongensis]|uniref:Excalibur calcium-binding domain-containing protein n=1 Tax=Cohnella hongkongensis TaxID=178337 RepID=A0ABV9F6L3_9BACL